ncbi:MAG: proton-conducting transporter membrane subunit, partial [Deltaproteobacteria bacterium]
LMVTLCTAAFGEKNSFFRAWNSIGLSNFMFGLFILFATRGHFEMSSWFLLSISSFWLLGLMSLKSLFKTNSKPSLTHFYALANERPTSAHFFLVSFLGIAGFPLFPSFLGEDIILHGLVGPYSPFALFGVLVLMLNGISAARLYTRVCWGPTSAV